MTNAVFAPQRNGAAAVFGPEFPLPPTGFNVQELGDSVAIVGANILQAYFGELVPSPGFMQLQEAGDSCDAVLGPITEIAGPVREASDATAASGFASPATSSFVINEAPDGCTINLRPLARLDCQEAGDSCKGDGIGGDIWTILGPTQAQWTDGTKVVNVWIDESRNGGQ